MIHPVLSALRRTTELAARRPRAALWTVLALACALLLAGVAAVVAATVDRWAAAHPGPGGNMVVYLGEGVDEARGRALARELSALRGVTRAELVPAAESASRLSRALGSDPALLDGVDVASLPASVEVTLAPGVRDVVAMSPTVRALRGAPGVDGVIIEDDGEDALAGTLDTVRTVAWTGAGGFAALALVIVLAAVRVGLDRSPREAAVLHLLGASPGWGAIPSALAGALHGAVAAVIAAGALYLLVSADLWADLHASLAPLAQLPLAAPPLAALAGLVALGGLVGLVGGGLAGVARAR